MPALTRPDAKRLLRFVGEAESLDGDDPFTSELLAELGRLVPAERVLYGELDRVRRRCVLDVRWPNGERRKVEREDDVWRFLEEHPLCLARREGHSGAIKLSDFLTQRELHRTWAYDFGFAPYEIGTSRSGTGSYSTSSSRIWRGSGTGQGRVGSSGRHYRVWDGHPSGTRAG